MANWKRQIDKMASWHNGKLTFGKLTKWQVDKLACWQNGKLTKWQVNKMASWQNNFSPCGWFWLGFWQKRLLNGMSFIATVITNLTFPSLIRLVKVYFKWLLESYFVNWQIRGLCSKSLINQPEKCQGAYFEKFNA